MSRLPIRVRLTLVFALAMAVVLTAVGAFVYLRLSDSLVEQIDESLEARAATLSQVVRSAGTGAPLGGGDEEFAQLIGPDGSVVAASRGFSADPLVSGELTTGTTLEREVDLPEEPGVSARLLAVSSTDGVLVVGASLEDRDEALDGLLAQLLIGGPIALLLASGAAYLLAGAALRPVEFMRARAAGISAETAAQRLPLPEARDEIFRLGQTLNAMLARLEEGLRRERRFVADAGHELRTPLALLQTELELALRRPRTPQELEAALRSASDEVDRLTLLAEDLLVLASSEEGVLQIRPTDLEAKELLESVARRFSSRAEAEGRSLDVSAPERLPIRGDRVRLEQALGNLVDNALRHGAGSVRVAAEPENETITLRVGDEGPGFPPEFLPHAFERFSRADAARARGGAGLGLAIVEAVARAHGGSVEASTSETCGAVVTLRLRR